MGRKKAARSAPDQSEKILMDHADVFADIINGLVYGGREVVKPENLRDGPTASRYKAAEGKYQEKDRDVVKIDTANNVAFMVYGLENQTKVNRLMPVRVMGYDYAMYEKNGRDIKDSNKAGGHEADYAEEIWPGQKLMPVITLVLYFGTEPWDGPVSLYDLVDVPEGLKKYIPDYRINLVQVAFLPEEVIAKFRSDFQIAAEFFRAKRLGKEQEIMYNNTKGFQHVGELMEFFHTFTGDKRYVDFKQHLIRESQKGEVRMCSLLDAFEKQGHDKGRAEGLAEGRAEGFEQGKYESLENLMQTTDMSVSEAMAALCFSEAEKSGYEKWKLDNKVS